MGFLLYFRTRIFLSYSKAIKYSYIDILRPMNEIQKREGVVFAGFARLDNCFP